MCLILFAWKKHPDYDLIVSANRDEFFNRPTQTAHVWDGQPDLIAGKDLTAGGTWLGITKTGKFAALTNYRDPSNINPKAPSRGHLTKDYLTQDISPQDYLDRIQKENLPFNGFNLLIGDNDSLWYYNSINHQITSLPPGVYGLSNALLNEPWPKVLIGQENLKKLIEQKDISTNQLLQIVQNKSLAADDQLPKTGIPIDWERALSAMYITKENYGTRCSTALLKKKDKFTFKEWSHSHLGQKEGQIEFIL